MLVIDILQIYFNELSRFWLIVRDHLQCCHLYTQKF